jgi:hypothetical protein
LKPFLLYTGARIGLFLACYGLIWLVFGRWIGWSSISALYTALIAMAVSSVIALVVLRSLRGELSTEIAGRAGRAKQAFDDRKSAEDDPDATP